MDEFVDVTGTGWARAYFILNYIIGVAVILNLVVTVVINSFWDEYKNTNKPALARRQLHAAAAASARHRPAARRPSLYITGSVGDGGASAGGAAAGAGDGGVAVASCHEDTPRKDSTVGGAAAAGGGDSGDGAPDTKAVVGHEIFGSGRGTERVMSERSDVDDVGGGDATGDQMAVTPPREYHLGVGGGGVESFPSVEGGTGWGWHGVSTTDEEHGEDVFSPTGPSRRGSRDSGRGSRVFSGQQPQPEQQQQQALPGGDETDMDAERRISRHASKKRLNVSGIT